MKDYNNKVIFLGPFKGIYSMFYDYTNSFLRLVLALTFEKASNIQIKKSFKVKYHFDCRLCVHKCFLSSNKVCYKFLVIHIDNNIVDKSINMVPNTNKILCHADIFPKFLQNTSCYVFLPLHKRELKMIYILKLPLPHALLW